LTTRIENRVGGGGGGNDEGTGILLSDDEVEDVFGDGGGHGNGIIIIIEDTTATERASFCLAHFCWPAPLKPVHQSPPLLVVEDGIRMRRQEEPPSVEARLDPRRPLDEEPPPPPPTPSLVLSAQRPRMRMEGRHQGVLWKRRDVFRNRWRPRWFVLQPGQGILTYYLLSGDGNVPGTIVSSAVATATATATPNSGGQNHQQPNSPLRHQRSVPASPDDLPLSSSPSPSTLVAFEASIASSSNHQHPRDRTTSWDSRASENTLDYDVVPRGTIYLLGCTVRANDDLTRPNDQVYCLTIDPPSTTETQIHLAARTAEQRDEWIAKIGAVCNASPASTPASSQHGTDDTPSRRIASSSTRSRNVGGTPTLANRTMTPTRPSIRTIPEHRTLHGAPTEATRASSSTTPARRSLSESNLPAPAARVGATTTPERTATATTGRSESSQHAWRSLSRLDPTSVYASLSDDTIRRLESAIRQGFEESVAIDPTGTDAASDWKTLYRQPNAVALRRRRPGSSAGTIRVDATLPHPIKHVFELLVDGTRLVDVEPRKSLKECRLVQQLNPHSTLDFVSYHGSWPTTPIDFAAVSHWQVLERGGGEERAICLISTSCPEANDATRDESPSPAIRGEVVFCWTLLRQQRASECAGGRPARESCRLTRILSVDLGPSAPSKLIGQFLNQRANLPAELSRFLGSYEPTPEARHKLDGPLTDDHLIRDIIHRLDETRKRAAERRRRAPPKLTQTEHVTQQSDDSSEDDSSTADKDFLLPPLDQQAVLLIAPLVVYSLSAWSRAPPSASFWFALTLYVCVRELVLLHLGPPVSRLSSQLVLGSVTCRFQIDLKGVLRLIANKKEEREELKRGNSEVTILHIVACAVATALKKEPTLCAKRVSIPWLCIDRLVQNDLEPLCVTFLFDNGDGFRAITIDKIDPNVQQVADDMKIASEHQWSRDGKIGTCLIVAAPNFDQVEMETDVIPMHPNVRVVCSIGGVDVARNVQERSGSSGRQQAPRPHLSLSLSVVNSDPSDYGACRRLAEDIQTLLRFPEMCDD
jgi:START domain